MLSLVKLVWLPCIQRSLTSKAQACEESTKQGKNLKLISPKQELRNLPTLTEPNEEIQMDFAGPIPFRNHTNKYYILVSVDRYSRSPRAQLLKDCDASIAIEYLEIFSLNSTVYQDHYGVIKLKHLKRKTSTYFAKDNKIKLILAPAGDHRATEMVEDESKP